jgi:hypothetical protein
MQILGSLFQGVTSKQDWPSYDHHHTSESSYYGLTQTKNSACSYEKVQFLLAFFVSKIQLYVLGKSNGEVYLSSLPTESAASIPAEIPTWRVLNAVPQSPINPVRKIAGKQTRSDQVQKTEGGERPFNLPEPV